MTLASNNFSKIIPDHWDNLDNSSYYNFLRFNGRTTVMPLTLNDGGAGAKNYIVFEVLGLIQVVRLYGIFTNVDNVTTVSDCSWQMYSNGDTAGPVLTLASTNCSDVSLGAALIKATSDADIAVLLDTDDVYINEEAGIDQFQSFIISSIAGTTTQIVFNVTEDANTDAVFTQYCDWIPLSEGASVVAGDGSKIPVA